MTQQEMQKFITDNVLKQGNEGAINIAPLLSAMVDKMFVDPETGVAPIVVAIAEAGTKDGTKTRYDVTTEQATINQYIDAVTEEKAKARLFIQDGDALIGVTYLEISETTITGQSIAPDGSYKLYPSKEAGTSYFEHDDEVKSIASVTEAEIAGYNEMFGATYDPVSNKFAVQIGTVSTQLTPGQMMLTTEEYNKASNDADYTAMWAYAIAEYICCPPWFEGFAGFKLHSAFYKAEKTIFIDLNTVELPVATLANAFYGCSRLEQITGILKIGSNVPVTDAFKGCAVLHTVKLSGLSSDIDLSDCAQLSAETIEHLIENSVQPGSGTITGHPDISDNINNITITVHPDVNNNINNNSGWADIRALLQEKTYITIQAATV